MSETVAPFVDSRTYARRWWTLGVLCLSLEMLLIKRARG